MGRCLQINRLKTIKHKNKEKVHNLIMDKECSKVYEKDKAVKITEKKVRYRLHERFVERKGWYR